MRLVLEKFRQHDFLEIEFPETGMVFLQGPSGIGKSTIFDAIYEVLTGEAEDVIPWGESKAKVTLYYKNLVIERTRGPISLKLTEGESVLRDEPAQARIYQILGMNAQELSACAYIRQEMEGSLLTLQPADQLRFIQTLALDGEDPEALKEKIKAYASEASKDLGTVEALIASTLSSIESQKASIESKKKQIPPEPKKPETEWNEGAFKALQFAEKDHLATIQSLKAQQQSPYYALSERSAALKERNYQIIDENKRALTDLETQRLPIPLTEVEFSELRFKMSAKETFLRNKELLTKVVAEFKEKTPAVGDQRISEFLKESLKSLEDYIILTAGHVAGMEHRLKELTNGPKHSLECPTCQASVKMDNGKLVPSDKPVDNSVLIAEVKIRLNELSETLKEKSQLKSYYLTIKAQCDHLVKNMGKDPEPSKTYDELQKAVTEYAFLKTHNDGIEAKISQLMLEIKKATQEIQKIDDDLAKYKDMPSLRDVTERLEYREGSLTLCRKHMAEQKEIEQKWALYNTIESQRQMLMNMIEADGDKLATSIEKLDELNKKKEVLNRKLAGAKRSREIIDFAVLSACDVMLDNINENTRNFLDKFFPVDGTSVVLKNATTKGGDKAKLTTAIYHKGKEPKKLSSMSGGERSRVYLASHLGLSETYNCPFLLIDEGFSGLPPEHKDQLIEYLKEFAENKLVVVIEHGANEANFQKVINIS